MNGLTMPKRKISILAVLALAALPLGCGGGTEMALVDPAKFQFHTCAQLGREMTKLGARAQELKILYDRAARDSTAVARIAYEADYLSTIGDMQLIETAARDNNCNPPVTVAGQAAAAPAPPPPAAAR